MRRTPVALLAAVLLAAPALAQDRPTVSPAPPQPPLKASLAACVSGLSEDERFAVFTGSMPAYRGTERMAMRFDLMVRAEGAKLWRPVRSKGFGRWVRSKRGASGLVWTKRVERLLQGAEYRATVRFRWMQAEGYERGERIRRTPVCRQPDQRPNLRVDAVTVLPGGRYRAVIVNDGRTAAGSFDVRLESSAPNDTRTVASLPAGEQATVELSGGACTADFPVRVVLDPLKLVDESSERDNRFAVDCGAASGSG
jgi:hypothetical protein